MSENTRLMNEYCTLVNKIFAFIQEYFDGIVPAGRPDPEIYHKTKAIYEQLENWGEDSEGKECRKDAAQVLLEEYLVFAEAYITKGNPWENRENNRSICRNTVLNSVQMIANLTVWLNELEQTSASKAVEEWLSLDNKWQVHSVHSGYELPRIRVSLLNFQ